PSTSMNSTGVPFSSAETVTSLPVKVAPCSYLVIRARPSESGLVHSANRSLGVMTTGTAAAGGAATGGAATGGVAAGGVAAVGAAVVFASTFFSSVLLSQATEKELTRASVMSVRVNMRS